MIENIERGCEKIIKDCADLKPKERVLVVSDETTREIGDFLQKTARMITDCVEHHTIRAFTMHGQEPPPETARAMMDSDVVFGVTHMSMVHTQARLAATNKGARYLSLPDYSRDVLADPSLLADFRHLTELSRRLGDILTKGDEVKITSKLGTDLTCVITGRKANAAPGWCEGPGTLASPPDAETNIAPLEKGSNGVLVVNGSIPYDGLGRLRSPIKFVIEDGQVVHIEGPVDETRLLEKLLWEGEESDKKRIVAELGFGLNGKANLCGVMLIDEGTLGTIHIGLGSNSTIGGRNKVNSHLDLVVDKPTVTVNGEMIMEEGRLLL